MRTNTQKDLDSVLRKLHPLMLGYEFESAELILRNAIKDWPKNPDLNAYYGQILAYSQREADALPYLQRSAGSKHAKALGQILVNHFHCRQLMAIKTGHPDPEGFQLLETAQLLFGNTPSDVGVALSACLIVKNEEAVLENCLASIKGLVDEIIVVDTGSTDGTVAIAKSFGAKIGHFEWTNDFGAARNVALQMATGRWSLLIDADETLPAEYHNAIREGLIRPHYAGFNIPIVNFMAEAGEAEQYVHTPVRLFQVKPGVEFTGRIHEQVTPSLQKLGLPFATLNDTKIFHEGYRPSIMAEKDKLNRALELLEVEVREDPNDSFQWFNLANAYAIGGRMPEAEHACRTSIRTLRSGEHHGKTAYQVLVETLEVDNRFEEALDIADEAKSRNLGTLATEFSVASLCMKLGRYEEALAASDRSMAMDWPTDQQGDYSVFTYKRFVLRGQILALVKRFEEAIDMLQAALEVNPECSAARYSLASIFEQQKAYEKALAAFTALGEEPGLQTLSLQGAARCCEALGDTAKAMHFHERAWRWEPSNLDAWVGWVNAAQAAGDSRLVLAAFESYVEDREPTVEILVNWGRALEASGDHERALSCFTEALKRDPRNANAYFNCGDLLYKMEQFADAAHIYESGLRETPLNPQGWFVLGNALARMDLPDGARIAYRQCLALDTSHAPAKNNLEFLDEAYPQAV